MDKIIYTSVQVRGDARRAFAMFTDNERLQSWLVPLADVEPVVGGKYELFWEPDDKENNSTLGCKVTALEPPGFISFEWRGPKQFKTFMNDADPLTHVAVCFTPPGGEAADDRKTTVHLIHSGWRSAPEWEEARAWFENAWRSAFEALRTLMEKSESQTVSQNHESK
jgi:uncharacterized protein YndB with AHSA1/START domain